jgi:hypothetical protein
MRKRRLAVAFLASLMLASGLFLWFLRWTAEEYAVDNAVIKEASEETSIYVILDTTQPVHRFGIPNFHSQKLGLPLSMKLSYAMRNFLRFHIPSKLSLPHPYQMVNQETLEALSAPRLGESRQNEDVEKLLTRSWGVITLSRVAFDHSMTHAVVYTQLTYCGLCGEGTYLYLSKETGRWHVVARSMTWIS